MNKSFKTNYYIHSKDDNIWEDDLLKRKESAQLLTRLLENVETPFSLIINSSWGTGKTFFLERWHKEISEKHLAVYFNAWESEITPIPLITFLESIKTEIKKDKNFYSELEEKIDKYIYILIAFIPFLISTYKDCSLNNIIEKGKEILDFSKVESKKNYDIKTIKEEFEEIIKDVLNILNQEEDSNRIRKEPIFIFIDELDRCRPDFAIRFLELIKHFFSVEGIVFVLALDLRQLETSIKHIYGSDIDCEGYLRKFINQFYNLPPLTRSFYANKLFEDFKNTNSLIGNYEPKALIDLFSGLSDFFSLSLRDMESVFSKFNMLSTISNEKSLFPAIILFYLCTQIKYPKVWNKFISNKKVKRIDSCFSKEDKPLNDDDLKDCVGDYFYQFYYITLFNDKVEKEKYYQDYSSKENYIHRDRLDRNQFELYQNEIKVKKEIYIFYDSFGEKQVDFVELVGNAFSYSLAEPEPQPGVFFIDNKNSNY